MTTVINADIQELALQMGVSYADLACLANSVVINMEKDKVSADAIPEDMRTDFALAYAQAAVTKFNGFVSDYLTKPHCRKNFIDCVAELANAAK